MVNSPVLVIPNDFPYSIPRIITSYNIPDASSLAPRGIQSYLVHIRKPDYRVFNYTQTTINFLTY